MKGNAGKIQALVYEADIDYEVFECRDGEGVLHEVDNETVLQLVYMASEGEQKRIKETLAFIISQGYSVNRFLKFLAETYIAKGDFYCVVEAYMITEKKPKVVKVPQKFAFNM